MKLVQGTEVGWWVLDWTDSSELMRGSSLLWRLYTFLVCFYIQTYPSDSICRLGLVHPFAGTRRNDKLSCINYTKLYLYNIILLICCYKGLGKNCNQID